VKKGIIFILLIIFLVFASVKVVFAFSSFGSVFGGRIIDTKAVAVRTLENIGYICGMEYFGTSLEILPLGSPPGTPTSYYIYNYTHSKTRTIPMSGKLIMGKYFGKMTQICRKPCPPGECLQTVTLDVITLFGTSR